VINEGRWARHLAHMGDGRNAKRIPVGKSLS
jgi:hypothetical protein